MSISLLAYIPEDKDWLVRVLPAPNKNVPLPLLHPLLRFGAKLSETETVSLRFASVSRNQKAKVSFHFASLCFASFALFRKGTVTSAKNRYTRNNYEFLTSIYCTSTKKQLRVLKEC